MTNKLCDELDQRVADGVSVFLKEQSDFANWYTSLDPQLEGSSNY